MPRHGDRPNSVRLSTGEAFTAERILIATGGSANPHASLPGHDHCITSNEAFHLAELPDSILIAGGGYIAVEFANIFHGLGVATTLIYRGKEILSRFDGDLRRGLHAAMEAKGIRIITEDVIDDVSLAPDGQRIARTAKGEVLSVGQIMLALGRDPNTKGLGLEEAACRSIRKAMLSSMPIRATSVPSIFALGDVTDRVQLTPVAIHEAMCFIETEYRGNPTAPDLDLIATASSPSRRSARSACRRRRRPSATRRWTSTAPSSGR